MSHGGVFDPEAKQKEIVKLEERTGDPSFWDDREEAEKTLNALKTVRKSFEPWQKLVTDVTNLRDLFSLAMEEKDESFEQEISEGLSRLEKEYESLTLLELLGDEVDIKDAFLTIHSGAGGTEACDWTQMLYRMYSRWAENKGYTVEILDVLEAEGGLKSITVQISGEYAYGYLKGETGIHRLVRISPFDANARRHTSFASVFVSPVIDEDIKIEIKPEDIRIDTFRAGGAGGQHVNKTDSAVRITHLETGIVVQCQNERSQFKNKDIAMKMLRSRLYEHYRALQEKEKEKTEASKKDISWGNQIRSYVFQPYTLVKDHRTKYEIGNIQSVMDGNIDPLIEEFLKWNRAHTS